MRNFGVVILVHEYVSIEIHQSSCAHCLFYPLIFNFLVVFKLLLFHVVILKLDSGQRELYADHGD